MRNLVLIAFAVAIIVSVAGLFLLNRSDESFAATMTAVPDFPVAVEASSPLTADTSSSDSWSRNDHSARSTQDDSDDSDVSASGDNSSEPALTTAALRASRQVAVVTAGERRVDFTPNFEFAGYTLTVTGPRGYRVTQRFEGNAIPTVEVPDGVEGHFSYELVGIPFVAEENLQEMMRVREEGGVMEVEEYGGNTGDRVQFGAFAQLQGTVSLITGDVGTNDQDEP